MNAASMPKKNVKAIATADWRIIFNRKPLLIIVAIALAIGALWGLWRYLTHPPRPFIVRWQISRFLKDKAFPAVFTVDFAFPSKAEMAKAPAKSSKPGLLKGSRTGKEFDALAREYIDLKTSALVLEREFLESKTAVPDLKAHIERHEKELVEARTTNTTNTASLQQQIKSLQQRLAVVQKKVDPQPEVQKKQEAIEPILADLLEFQKTWETEMQSAGISAVKELSRACAQLGANMQAKLEEASSYAAMYQIIGQQLYVAKRLLASANPDLARAGLTLALQASRFALDYAGNGWLAGRICEGYIWPHLDLATDSTRRSPFSLENLLNQCADVFRQNEEPSNVIRTYKILLAKAKTPQAADSARGQLGMAYQRNGEAKEALSYLKQIKGTNDPNFRWVLWQIPRLERQLKTGR